MKLPLLLISLNGIWAIIVLIGLMLVATRKLFTIGWKKMTNEERLLAIVSLIVLIIIMIIVCIITFN